MRLAVFVRKSHKWLALFVGVQALLWTVTGLYMTAVHIDYIHGDHLIRTPEPAPYDVAALAAPGPLIAATPGASGLRLIRILDRPAYVVDGAGAPAVFDALNGRRLAPPSEEMIRTIAAARYRGEGAIARVELLAEVPDEIRGRPAPVWRVEFDHWNEPTFYLSPHSGELLARRHELWRIFDFAWMLHILDFEAREDVNNLVLRVATLVTLLMTLAGAALLVWSFPKRRKAARPLARPKLSPLTFRQIHKWVGIVLGIQFLLWTVSGAGMALLDHDRVMGHGPGHARHVMTIAPDVVPPAAVAAAIGGAPVTALALRPLPDRLVYEATTPAGLRLVDARSGRETRVTAAVAEAIARHEIGAGTVQRVSRVAGPTLETRKHDGAAWRVDFADADGMSVYVSEATGRVLERRTDTWRLFDLLWMLHTMDYSGRDDFNHPLVIAVTFGVLWLTATGVYLLFVSFRRSDFRWRSAGQARSG